MLQETIILTALYILIIGILYAPKCPAQTATDAPIDYFPNVEESPEKAPTQEPIPVSVSPVKNIKKATVTPSSEMAIAPNPSPDLKSLSIRALKKLASEKKVPRYSNLTKSQLIAAMA